MYKKAWCTCSLVVLLIKPIAFLTLSLPSPSCFRRVPIDASSTVHINTFKKRWNWTLWRKLNSVHLLQTHVPAIFSVIVFMFLRYSLSAYLVIRCVWLCIINTWRVCQTRVHKSLIGNNLPGTLSLSLCGGTRLSRQTSKTSKSKANLSPAERWKDGRWEEFVDNCRTCSEGLS